MTAPPMYGRKIARFFDAVRRVLVLANGSAGESAAGPLGLGPQEGTESPEKII